MPWFPRTTPPTRSAEGSTPGGMKLLSPKTVAERLGAGRALPRPSAGRGAEEAPRATCSRGLPPSDKFASEKLDGRCFRADEELGVAQDAHELACR